MHYHKVPIRGRFKHQIRSDYFDQIDTFYKAYFLGWLASDGCISPTRGTPGHGARYDRMGKIKISIQARDGYVLDKLREELGFSGEVTTKTKGPGRQDQRALSFCDQHMAQALYRLGLTPNKSFSLGFPDIPDRWIPAFILGYFEGDGSITWAPYTSNGYTAIRQRFDIIASVPFANRLLDLLNTRYGIKAFGALETRKSQPLKYVKGGSIDAVVAFYRLLYTDAPFYLKRKRERFEALFAARSVTP